MSNSVFRTIRELKLLVRVLVFSVWKVSDSTFDLFEFI